MKEASGEANLTVVTIILIGVVVAIATPLVNSMMQNSGKRACCTDAGGYWKGSQCYNAQNQTMSQSQYWDNTNKKCKA